MNLLPLQEKNLICSWYSPEKSPFLDKESMKHPEGRRPLIGHWNSILTTN
jgi:hypothetical protein